LVVYDSPNVINGDVIAIRLYAHHISDDPSDRDMPAHPRLEQAKGQAGTGKLAEREQTEAEQRNQFTPSLAPIRGDVSSRDCTLLMARLTDM